MMPNAFTLYDMSGNRDESVRDCTTSRIDSNNTGSSYGKFPISMISPFDYNSSSRWECMDYPSRGGSASDSPTRLVNYPYNTGYYVGQSPVGIRFILSKP